MKKKYHNHQQEQALSSSVRQQNQDIKQLYEAPRLYILNEININTGNISNLNENSSGMFQSQS